MTKAQRHISIRLKSYTPIKLSYLANQYNITKSEMINRLIDDAFRLNFDNTEQAILELERYKREVLEKGGE